MSDVSRTPLGIIFIACSTLFELFPEEKNVSSQVEFDFFFFWEPGEVSLRAKSDELKYEGIIFGFKKVALKDKGNFVN